jgi:mannose-1-phosphate guanylyltransferase
MLSTMILSAGLGTRLRPLTLELPKPLVPVGDAPVIEHIRRHLVAGGWTHVVTNAHHLSQPLEKYARTHNIQVSIEEELLGTAGGVHHATPMLGDGDVLVWNGDMLASPDVSAGLELHQRSRAVATLWARPVPLGQGNIGCDGDGHITRLRREVFGHEVASAEFAGIHILGAAARTHVPQTGCLVSDVYLPLLRAGHRLQACGIEAFRDVGSLGEYAAANFAWLQAHNGNYIHPTASIAARVRQSVIGAGAAIHADVDGCIVWPGATVNEPAEHCIITETQRVSLPTEVTSSG